MAPRPTGKYKMRSQKVGKCSKEEGTYLTETAARLKGLPLANNLIIEINNENRDYNPLNKTEMHKPSPHGYKQIAIDARRRKESHRAPPSKYGKVGGVRNGHWC